MNRNMLIMLALAGLAYWYWKKHRFDDASGKDPG